MKISNIISAKAITRAAGIFGIIGLALSLVQAQTTQVTADPIPAIGRGPAIDPKLGYHVGLIRDGVYFVTEGSHQIMFATTGKGVVVVDAPPVFGNKLPEAIRSVTSEPITHLIYSHAHPDHIGAAASLPKEIVVVASEGTAKSIAESKSRPRVAPFGVFVGAQTEIPAPTSIFKGQRNLTVGNKTFELRELAQESHSAGDTLVYLQKQRVLMAVDFVWSGWVPFEGLGIGDARNITGYRQTLSMIQRYDYDTLISGHVGRPGTRQDVQLTIDYVDALERNVVKALQTVQYGDALNRTGYDNPFLTVDVYFRDIVQQCAQLTLQQWRGRLAGVDVWVNSHCQRMAYWLRLN
jgi:glyoxylase-like metal-dependent hydrolase (beta-lactamase superfamily II)